MSPSIATSGAISVLVADSNRMQAQLLITALRHHPEFRTFSSRMEISALLHIAAAKSPTVALISTNSFLSVTDNMAMLRHFHLAHPEIGKILLVGSCDRELTVNAFRSGVRGIFSLSDSNLRLLCKCIQQVANGQIWATTEQMNHLVNLIAEVPSLRVVNAQGNQLLTPREEQVVALVSEGLSNREVARELDLSEHTVKKYLFRIFEKLGISTRVELVLYAMNHGAARGAEWLAGAAG